MTKQFDLKQKTEARSLLQQDLKPKYTPIEREVSNPSQSPLKKWFSNLPVNRKQLLALLASEFFSVVGIAGVGSYLIWNTGHQQLREQSKSEVAVTQINYMIKINQMGFGFRGQSDNTAIISAAVKSAKGEKLPAELQQQVKQILMGEITARQIEYATLVGKDQKIIMNANGNRKGETFNPNNLVTQVLQSGQQLKASAIVAWVDLVKEGSPLPEGLNEQDALIRYTATPVKDPSTKEIVGVLISGDIVNGKLPIAKSTLESFEGGYSGVYYRKPDGSFALATSLLETKEGDKKPNIAFPEPELLQKAVNNPGERITQRGVNIDGQVNTTTAMTLPDLWQQTPEGPVPVAQSNPPVTILVRGTSENSLNKLLLNTLLIQLGLVGLALMVDFWLANILSKAIVKPIQRLQRATQRFAQGDRNVRSPIVNQDEVGQLASTFNYLADNISQSEREKALEAQQKESFSNIVQARSAPELSAPLEQVLREAKTELGVDRLFVYRFLADWTGCIAGEVVEAGFPAAGSAEHQISLMDLDLLEGYKQGEVVAHQNIDQGGYAPEQLQWLKRLKIKSNLIAPIVSGEELIGLIYAAHCQTYHDWEPSEKDYLQSLAERLGQALSGLAFLERKQAEAERTEQQSQTIQGELLRLLTDVEGAASGNLTVRANISEGQIGIVADFFNVILESLRDIVTQVKKTTTQVNQSLGEEAKGVYQLADESRQQAQKIQEMLNWVQAMSYSIQAVAENAGSAASVARNASEVAKAGETGMTQTVDSILNLRETVSTTAKKVKRLGEASQKISKVIALINEIALKTNLLAVNASIEAARAGEEGRGFAVVAEEVGQLAAQSAAATKEIEQIVETIQLETHEVVEAMEIGTAQVVEGTDLVTKAKESLRQIVAESQQINDLVQNISEVTVSQTQTSQELTDLMKEIALISNQTSEASQDISSSLEKTVAIAQELQASVEMFKVE
ncbi:methyl-accepting chemotaxis protein [Gloeocapsa sp. PCC 73106]|uniref:methyl-accepting chemotaxis protein n=1 Tax=Gloeocapsa sp. PCC 73106 TaxID=102232 RepID=UPI0002AC7920|nr:methyl-accepting chemotaxis protein [Gloeocapsa sp. PCC 73106]ELR96849.1 methyl-accepting chemotaxis protein [Gloeocapsa sp. PCC 73106]